MTPPRRTMGLLAALLVAAAGQASEIDRDLATKYFDEAAALCEREGGTLWGTSLCGPMVFADPASGSVVTNQAAPDAPRPRALGYANAALEWGEQRWSAFVWPMMPSDETARAQLMLHELFHRVQPALGLLLTSAPGRNDHLDTAEGRYWMRLEWRALQKALASAGEGRLAAIRHALAFREARRSAFPGAGEIERISEINEGLAQYTGTVAAACSREAALASAIDQLGGAAEKESFVQTFAYPSGAAWGLLLDGLSPGWTRRIDARADLGRLVAESAGVEPAVDASAAAKLYGGGELREAEEKRAAEREAHLAALRARFVEGPVLILPRGRNASFITTGVTPIPGVGTVFPQYRVAGEWGSLEANLVLVSTDGRTLRLPGPVAVDGSTLSGDGWSVTLSPGWTAHPGEREGDLEVRRTPPVAFIG